MALSNPLDSQAPAIQLNNKPAIDALLDQYLATTAFDDLSVTGSSRRSEVRRRLIRFLRGRTQLDTFQSPITYSTLKANFKHQIKPTGNSALLSTFTRKPSTPYPLQIQDSQGNLLGYRFRVPEEFIQTLNDSQQQLPAIPPIHTVRGDFQVRHYAIWADSAKSPFMSAEYRRQLPHSQQWLDDNNRLFQRLSDDLRFIEPKMFVKFRSVLPLLPPQVEPLCGIWHGCAINSGLDDPVGSGTHQDVKDYTRGFNCVLPYGEFTGADLVLWQLKLMVELRPGDVFMFYGSLIAHNVTGIESGERCSVDMFCHGNVFQWKKKVVTGKTEGGQHTEKVGYGQYH